MAGIRRSRVTFASAFIRARKPRRVGTVIARWQRMSPTTARRGRRLPATTTEPPAEVDLRDPSLYFDRDLCMALVQRPGARAGEGGPSSARARQVLRDRREQPRRVLHGPPRPGRLARESARHRHARRALAAVAEDAAPAARGRAHSHRRRRRLQRRRPRLPRTGISTSTSALF